MRKAATKNPGVVRNGARRDAWLLKTISSTARAFTRTKVRVEVSGGFVTLTGGVATFRQRERLHRFVMALKGVRALKDLLRVWPVETIADRDIALHVRQALDAHAELPPGTASVHVRAGVVTLEGHVRTAEERSVSEQVASHCRGVTHVENRLTVNLLDEITDEATARAIRDALAYCKDFETNEVNVSCADGRVLLRGEVPTLLDRMLAEELARLQAGVCVVENHIHVAPAVSLDGRNNR
jgi:osmotically-inducible protein OsmY